jgi:hypothetical protein
MLEDASTLTLWVRTNESSRSPHDLASIYTITKYNSKNHASVILI